MIGECNSRRIVFTGGPGFGKSAVLEALARDGFTCMPEAPRQLILEQREVAGGVLPQDDFVAFAEMVIDRMTLHHRNAGIVPGPVFFDRGLPDIFAYLRYAGHHIAPRIRQVVSLHPYDSPMFFFPDWEELYQLDGVRYETFEQARDIGLLIRESYEELGYLVVDVPKDSIKKRASFIRDCLDRNPLV